MLELINRARANPSAEAARLGIDLNEGLSPGTISAAPKPPLSFNPHLIQSARTHSQWLLDNDVFDHTGADGSRPGDRMAAAGYPFSGSWGRGENLAWQGTTGTPNLTEFTADEHDDLFRSPGHRKNLMNANFDEIGIGVLEGQFTYQGREYNSVMTTQNFARSAGTPGPLLVGVVYRDANGDSFYSVGEGLAGVTVAPDSGSYFAITSASGGYAIPLSSTSGSMTVTVSGGTLATSLTKAIELQSQNLKLDFEANHDSSVRFVAASARRLEGGEFECRVTGPNGQRVVVEASSDFSVWRSLSTNVLAGGEFTFRDDSAPESGGCFYRALPAP